MPRRKKFKVWKKDNFICQYCGRNLKDEYYQNYPSDSLQITVEHIVAISAGGTNNYENLTTACLPCNQKRAIKVYPEIYPTNA